MEEIAALYCTDNALDEEITSLCRARLESHNIPIISVSQEPIDFGLNICVGKIGRSLSSMVRQLLKAAGAATTKYVCATEHDCVYPEDYFSFEPPEDDVFYYNTNSYILYPQTGFFSKRGEGIVALSQLTANRKLLVEDLRLRVSKLDAGYKFTNMRGARCEPGRSEYVGIFLHPETNDVIGLPERKYDFWTNKSPVIDIRHSRNLTKMVNLPAVQDKTIPYWGSWEDVKNPVLC